MTAVRKRVLLVEDHEDVRRFLCNLLSDAGYEVDAAADYREGLAKLTTGSHDLLICNVLLPGGKGTELAEIAKARGMKFLLVTGHPEEMQAFNFDEQSYVPKPFKAGALLDRVNLVWEGD